MPELPEVETLKLQLSDVLSGLIIKKVEVITNKSFIGNPEIIIGKKIKGLRRFAKILVFDLTGDLSIAIHLKLTGQLIYRGKRQPQKIVVTDPLLKSLPNKHTRVIIDFTNGDRLFFNDQRIFGWMRILQSQKSRVKSQNDNSKLKNIVTLQDLIAKLGPDPLEELVLDKFKEILKSSKRLIKLVLMDQEKIAGVGNIYANDALFLAKISPKKSAHKISDKESEILFNNLLKVLREGIKWRGSSQNHYRDAFGLKGEKQEHFYVYDREGEDCPNGCNEKIRRIALGGRGTFYCPKCQKKV